MNNSLSKFIIFTTGAAIGSVVTWKLVKTKYERIAQEEIDSVIAEFNRLKEGLGKKTEETSEEEKDEPDERDEEYEEYDSILRGSEYVQYAKDKLKFEKEDKDVIEPYVIPPEEFDENGYETETLYYFADGVLADGCNEIVNNIDELIGEDSLTHFGEYEEDSVFVRNENLETDFEILKDRRRFSEVS